MGEKPTLGREGANVSYYEKRNGLEFAAKGSEHSSFYDQAGYIYQQKFELPNFDGMYPMIGSWVVGDVACGIGLREDFTLLPAMIATSFHITLWNKNNVKTDRT